MISAAAARARHLEAMLEHPYAGPTDFAAPCITEESTVSLYTPMQRARALASAAGVKIPPRVIRIDVSQAPDGSCVVTVIEQRRDAALDVQVVVTLTREQTRAWREALHKPLKT